MDDDDDLHRRRSTSSDDDDDSASGGVAEDGDDRDGDRLSGTLVIDGGHTPRAVAYDPRAAEEAMGVECGSLIVKSVCASPCGSVTAAAVVSGGARIAAVVGTTGRDHWRPVAVLHGAFDAALPDASQVVVTVCDASGRPSTVRRVRLRPQGSRDCASGAVEDTDVSISGGGELVFHEPHEDLVVDISASSSAHLVIVRSEGAMRARSAMLDMRSGRPRVTVFEADTRDVLSVDALPAAVDGRSGGGVTGDGTAVRTAVAAMRQRWPHAPRVEIVESDAIHCLDDAPRDPAVWAGATPLYPFRGAGDGASAAAGDERGDTTVDVRVGRFRGTSVVAAVERVCPASPDVQLVVASPDIPPTVVATAPLGGAISMTGFVAPSQPPGGSPVVTAAAAETPELLFTVTSPTSGLMSFACDIGILTKWAAACSAADGFVTADDRSPYVARRLWVGKERRTPVTVTARAVDVMDAADADADADVDRRARARGGHIGPRACLVESYGAYGDECSAALSAERRAALDAGWAIATVHLPGGGELGRAWHRSGCAERRGAAADDLADAWSCLRSLLWPRSETGCGTGIPRRGSRRSAARGFIVHRSESAGAVAAAAAALASPERIDALVLRVPFLGPFDEDGRGPFPVDPSTDLPPVKLLGIERGEWDDGNGAGIAWACDALRPARGGATYPPTLILGAEGDEKAPNDPQRRFVDAIIRGSRGERFPGAMRTWTRAMIFPDMYHESSEWPGIEWAWMQGVRDRHTAADATR